MLNYEHKPNLNYRIVVNVMILISLGFISLLFGGRLYPMAILVYEISRSLLSEFTNSNYYLRLFQGGRYFRNFNIIMYNNITQISTAPCLEDSTIRWTISNHKIILWRLHG